MPAVYASAPGKIILFGEHAVVYGRPAIAAPVTQVQAKAYVLANPSAAPGHVEIDAPAIALHARLDELDEQHPIAYAIRLSQQKLAVDRLPAFKLRISSTIPIAAGLGSGAAISAAVARVVSGFLGRPLPDTEVNDIAFRVDQIYHGTPSGIDNTVITYARPIYFIRGMPVEFLTVYRPLTIVIANSGILSPTGVVVGDVRQRYQADPSAYEPLFDQIAMIAAHAREDIVHGDPENLGALMNQNHHLLQRLNVSCAEVDCLVEEALANGALGAKLCGAGRGGNMIALVDDNAAESVAMALQSAGAVGTIITRIS